MLNDGTQFLTFASDKKATFYGHIFLPSTGTSTPTNHYIATNNSSTGTGSLTIQAGEGSSGNGGGLRLYSHSHASNAGWVKAGISVNSGGKFAVNTHGTGGGTDVFTVDASGNTVISGDISLTGTRYIKASNDLHLWADNTAMASFWTSGGNEYALLRGTAKAQDKFEQIGTLTNSFGGGATFGGDVNISKTESSASERISALKITRGWSSGSATDRLTAIDFIDNNSVQAGIVANRYSSHLTYASSLEFYVNNNSSSMTPATALSSPILTLNGTVATFAGDIKVIGANNSAGDLYTQVGSGNVPHISIQNTGTTSNNNGCFIF